jgi:hypothetical protein
MSAVVRLSAAVVALSSACHLNPLSKPECYVPTDCPNEYTCVSNQCVLIGGPGTGGGGAGGGGTAGGGTGGGGHAGSGRGGTTGSGNGGSLGPTDAGPDVSPPGMCPPSPVTACPPADGGSACEETVCGSPPWRDGALNAVVVQFRFDPTSSSMFTDSYKGAIRAAAAAWKTKSAGLVTIKECVNCMGQFISVVPGVGDGIMDPGAVEQHLPMPVASDGSVSPHWIAHQWGHVVGLSHTYQRADRDRYVGFDPNHWCPPGGAGLPPRCTTGPTGVPPSPFPAVATGTFGVFDEKSKMNGLPTDGVCGAGEPDEDSSEPTLGDVSAEAELFFGTYGNWSPFLPIGRSVSPTLPLDYQLAPGVDPTGSPAIAEDEYASPEIFVRGTDDNVYRTKLDLTASPPDWTDWAVVAEDVDDDPAVSFSPHFVLSAPGVLFLAVRSVDGNINLKVRTGDEWSPWTALGAPPAGAASAPAVAAADPNTIAVVVRGRDGLIYWLNCTDAGDGCVTSATGPGAWVALPAPSMGIFVSKPSAVWPISNVGLVIAAVRDDRLAQVMMHVDAGGGDWLATSLVKVNGDLALDDPDPGVALTYDSTPNEITFFARNGKGLLVSDTTDATFPSIGGVLLSPPAAVAYYEGPVRTDVAALVDDHGHPGVWWRFNDVSYTPPCNASAPCTPCGP